MSNWTNIRDSILDALEVENVTTQLKEEMTNNLLTNGIPAVKAVADKFTSQLQQQAKNERGWNKLRDQVVLPLIISGTIWAVQFSLRRCTNTQQNND
ncbi:hypothetical protein [uncultured Megasphaera sp.]|uniref:hypothetical protein n=1 Tax=uncultured Megasphaera sp. TaxID=165188 RepID=UPI00266CA39E|nr:hypothetical protein [uncultured Megasphaera sp.]